MSEKVSSKPTIVVSRRRLQNWPLGGLPAYSVAPLGEGEIRVDGRAGRKHSPNPFVVPRFIGAGQRNLLIDRMNAVTTNGLGKCLPRSEDKS